MLVYKSTDRLEYRFRQRCLWGMLVEIDAMTLLQRVISKNKRG